MALEDVRNKKIQLARGMAYDAFVSVWTGDYPEEVIDLNRAFVANKSLLGRELEEAEKDKLRRERQIYTRLNTVVKEIKALNTEEEINAYKITY